LLACSWSLFAVLTRPLRNVIHLARQYAAGDLRSSLPVTRQDEVGQLIDAINGIGGGLQKIVLQVREAAGEIHLGTNALASDTGEISEQINKQASSVEETSASMEQLAATVQQNAANMEQTQQLVGETSSRSIRAVRRSPTRCRPWTTFAKRQNASKTSRA
jgi:methyl-accepting chemotaxis protein